MLLPSRRGRYAALALVAVGVAYSILRSPLEINDARAGVLGGLVALVGSVDALLRYLDARRKPVDTAAEGVLLAEELLERWGPELSARRQRSGAADALPVQWRQAGPSGQLRRVVTANPEQAVLDVAKAFRDLPKQRAVLLGEPGGGKTFLAISLVVGLLTEQAADGKVPVLLSLSAWDPVEDELDTFIVRALAAAHYAGAERIPKALLDKNVIFPVLDGLDELPEHLRRRALSRINATLAGNRRILLTCRSVEYAEGIAAGAPALSQAPVFEVLPLTPEQISRRLGAEPLWAPVAQAIRENPVCPLGIALSTPLMLSLFTRAYTGRNPADLLTLTSGNDVRDHLVDVLIDSVYPQQGKGWTALQARRYLTYLARYLKEHTERELDWWKLPNRVLSPWTGALVGLIGGGVVAAVLAPLEVDDPTDVVTSPFISAGVFGLVCTVLWFLGMGRRSGQASPGFRQGARDGALLVAVPAVITLVIGLAVVSQEDRLGEAAAGTVAFVCLAGALAAVCALAVGLHRHLVARAAVAGRAEPDDVLRRERRATLFGAATTLVLVSTLSAALWKVTAAASEHIAQRTAATLGVPTTITPISTAMEEMDAPPVTGIIVLILAGAVLLMAAVLLTSRWPRYVVAKVLLWGTGQLPLRLERFLRDARDKGVLRAGVTGYEFWHVALQERLVVRGKDLRLGRPVVRTAALWLAAAAVVSAVVVVDLTQPEACTTTGLPHADSRLFTVVAADGASQCAAKLDAADVADLLGGGISETEAEKVRSPHVTRPNYARVTILGQFSTMSSGTFNEVAQGMTAADVDRTFELYTLPFNSPIADPAVSLLWSKIGHTPAAFLLHSDGSVLVTGAATASVTTKDPVEIAKAAIAHAAGPISSLSAEAVLDGVDIDECASLEEERFAKSIDLRGHTISLGAMRSLEECGEAVIVASTPVPQKPSRVKTRYLTDEPIERADRCRAAPPSPTDVSVAVCAVLRLMNGVYTYF